MAAPSANIAAVPSRRIAVIGPLTGGSLSIAECSVRALRRLGHQVTYVDNTRHMPVLQAISASADPPAVKDRMRDAFLDMVRADCRQATSAARPEVALFLAQAPVMRDDDVADLRAADVPTIFWFVEDHRVFPYWRSLAGRFDHFWSIQPAPSFAAQLVERGQRFVDYVPLACDPEIHRPRSAEESSAFAADVSFVGTGYPNRTALLRDLARSGTPLRLHGTGWTAIPELREHVAADGTVPYEQLALLFSASRINLNLSSEVDRAAFEQRKDFVNPRAFEICACGGFQLAEALSPIEWFFEVGAEVETFSSLEEARSKIAHYLAHEADRRRIADAGRRRALSEHTYDRRLEAALGRAAEHDPRIGGP